MLTLDCKTRVAVRTFHARIGWPPTELLEPLTIMTLQAATAEKPAVKHSVPSVPAAPTVFIQPRAIRRISEIIIHCSATPEGREVSVETIRGWHIGQNWKDIGYPWMVMLDGTVKLGRPET